MTDEQEAMFENLANEAILAAEQVECPGSVFVEGLKLMAELLQDRVRTATDEFGEGG
jgi:hypothetical protein